MINITLEHLDNLSNFYNEIKNQLDEPKMLLNGNEIMEILNIKPSKKIGEILDELKELQLSGEIKTKDGAIKFIKKQK